MMSNIYIYYNIYFVLIIFVHSVYLLFLECYDFYLAFFSNILMLYSVEIN